MLNCGLREQEQRHAQCDGHARSARGLRGSSASDAHSRSFCPDSCRKAHVVRRHSFSRVLAFSTEPKFFTKYWREGDSSISSSVMYHGPARSAGTSARDAEQDMEAARCATQATLGAPRGSPFSPR